MTQALRSFSKVIQDRLVDEDLIDSYHGAFKNVSDDKFTRASHRCFDDCKFFPKIAEIKERISHDDTSEMRNFYIAENIRCSDCNKVASCIKEPKESQFWQCRECYTGLTSAEIKKRFNDLIMIVSDPDYCPVWVKELAEKHGCSDSLQRRIDRSLKVKPY